jgi:predicted amidohydrolase
VGKSKLRVAAVQLNSQADVAQNLRVCEELVLSAHTRGAKLIVLPENFAYFGDSSGRALVAESAEAGGPIHSSLQRWALRTKAMIVAGGMPEKSDDPERPYNTALAFAPNGEIAARYRKIHLFDVSLADGTALQESATTARGSSPAVAELEGWRVGLSICYDVRFPELFRALSEKGADVFVVPAAFTLHTGKDHWHVLLRARAIESQSWVIGSAQWGKHPANRTTYGHSLIADPWGTVVAEHGDGVGVVESELDPDVQARIRKELPALAHRRL